MYRIVCKFIPTLQYTPTGGRKSGSWRVVSCTEGDPLICQNYPVMTIRAWLALPERYLVLSSPTPRQPNSWCSPRRIIEEWLAERRAERDLPLPPLLAAYQGAYHDVPTLTEPVT